MQPLPDFLFFFFFNGMCLGFRKKLKIEMIRVNSIVCLNPKGHLCNIHMDLFLPVYLALTAFKFVYYKWLKPAATCTHPNQSSHWCTASFELVEGIHLELRRQLTYSSGGDPPLIVWEWMLVRSRVLNRSVSGAVPSLPFLIKFPAPMAELSRAQNNLEKEGELK